MLPSPVETETGSEEGESRRSIEGSNVRDLEYPSENEPRSSQAECNDGKGEAIGRLTVCVGEE